MKSKILPIAIFFILLGQALCVLAGPTISSFSPSQGQVGTLVTINGSNLGNPTSFSIGGKAAVVISNTGSQLVGFVMPGATTGIISITTSGGTANSTGTFTVLQPTYPSLQQGGPLVGTQSASFSEQGTSVAISADGNTALVGASNDQGGVGASFVYTRTGGTWTQQAELIGTGETSNYAMQGGAVALSADGNTAMIGGHLDGTSTDGVSGAVWFFTRTGNTWMQQGNKIAGTGAIGFPVHQGETVALSADGNTAVEGGPQDNGGTGAAWVFTRNAGVWTQLGLKLTGTGAAGNAGQGAVGISADGNTIIVGGGGDNNGEGASWIFTRNGSTWTQQGSKLVGTSAGTGDAQGSAVALSADGNTAIIGGPNGNAAWAFTRTNGTWSQLGGEFTFPGGTANSGSQEGAAVAVSADGNTALAGGYGSGNSQGGTWLYTRSGGAFANQGSMILGTGTGFTGSGSQGSSVALSANGTTGLVGAYGNNNYQGLAFVLTTLLPSVTTTAATGVTSNGATINGYASAPQFSANVSFQYGTDPNLAGAKTTTTFSLGANPLAAGSSNVNYSSNLSGLTEATTYYFSINAANVNGTASGAILNFKTPGISFSPLAAVTYGAADITPVATSTNTTIPILFASSDISVATITSGGEIHIVGAGSTTITASQTGSGYQSVTRTLKVKQAPLKITAVAQSRLYGAANPALTVTYNAFVNGDTPASLTTQPTISTTATASSPAGAYPITASGAVDPNYTISYVAGTLTVTKAALKITANNKTRTYGSANPSLTVTYSGFANGDTNTSLTTQPTISTTATASSPAGTYTITASGAADPNYAISYVAGTLTVEKKALSITANNKTRTYGSANPVLTATYSGFVNGDTNASLTTQPTISTTATISSPASAYPITASGAADPNYAISYVAGTLTVGKKALSIAANNKTRTYGSANPALTVTYTGFVNGDTQASLTTQPTISTTATISSPAAAYPITASGAADPNYSISYVAGTLTVTKAALVIAANNKTRTYGSANPALTVTYSGFVNGDTNASLTSQPTVATTATKTSPASTYPITASGAADPNYSISYTAGTLTVAKAALTITANNKTKTAGSANPALTVSYNGFVNGDTKASLTTQPTVSTTATTSSPAGTYPITARGAADPNYKITYVAGVLTVTSTPGNSITTVHDVETSVQNDNIIAVIDEPVVRQAVSPNGDGINDFLQIDGISNYPDNKLIIMSRSGMLVFEANGYDNNSRVFDGHSNKNGRMQLPGTYFYSLDYTVKGVTKHKTGFIVLKY